MSAVSMPMPIMRASRRTMTCGLSGGARSSSCARACSTSLIWSMTNRSRAMSRRSSSSVLGGSGTPSGVRSAARRSGALRNVGLKVRTPKRAKHPFIRQTPLHPVDQARSLTDEPLALTVGALGILLRQRRDRDHVAVIRFAAQPADEDAFEQSRIEAICLGPAMLAGDGHAGWVDHVGFDAAGPEPARQPEAVAARLEGDRDAGDRAAVLGGLRTPAH